MSDSAATPRSSGSLREAIGGVISAIGVYFLCPLGVELAKVRLSPDSSLGKAFIILYPDFISNGIVDAHSGESEQQQAVKPPAASSSKPDSSRVAVSLTPLTVAPAAAPVQAWSGPVVMRNAKEFQLTLHLQAKADGLPAYVVRRGGYLLGWSGAVRETGANCGVFWSHIASLPVTPVDWTPKTPTYALSAAAPVPIIATFNCDKPLDKGETVEITARIGTVDGDESRMVNISSGTLPLIPAM